MFFQKSKTSITHFTIFAANEEITKFIIYKFNNNLHIVDSRIKTLNPNYDIILFSLPHKKYFSFNFPGIFENGKFIFIRSLTINKESFYTYEVEAEKKKINVSQIIFDKNLVPVEFDLTNGSAVCNCTKSKIIIRLN